MQPTSPLRLLHGLAATASLSVAGLVPAAALVRHSIVPYSQEWDWRHPSQDVRPNPACKPVAPRIAEPVDVTELHPGHLKYTMAIGDSMTAAALAGGGPVEYRKFSWSAGAGTADHFTMPFLLRQYSEQLVGASVGSFQWAQLAPCCGKAPWWMGVEGGDNQLNAALDGAKAADWELEVRHLTHLVTGQSFGDEAFGGYPGWSQARQEDYRRSWKVLNIALGMNNVLTNADACSPDEDSRAEIVRDFNVTMTALFEHLFVDRDGIFQKLYVNLGTLFATTLLGKQGLRSGWCRMAGGSLLKNEFICMRSGGDVEAKALRLERVTAQMNEVLREIAARYDRRRPDLGVNLFETPADQEVTHEDLRSPLDCFHPTAKAHRILGTALWNSMLKPSRPQPLDELPNTPECAHEATRLVTYSRAKRENRRLSRVI